LAGREKRGRRKDGIFTTSTKKKKRNVRLLLSSLGEEKREADFPLEEARPWILSFPLPASPLSLCVCLHYNCNELLPPLSHSGLVSLVHLDRD